MRRVLLTSGQVSVLATAAMILLCTSALFLSGYAIQQRTLRELRAAIRPRQSPKAHLPEEFRGALADLEESNLLVEETPVESKPEPEPEPEHKEQKEEEHKEETIANKAPISRAERRKMIKDEIQRLAQSEKPVYYQRRLW
ncbi:uncharacterized protein TRIVIDRAFT_57769 [Trichoderma virens Gv29-8]|uniref:Uncharacterized protein n=1 Tax=Hypocrea virens (strain Gv29-8 / FGSC 10586) TaxID=413071 RepID=G9N2R9_HYPVG|nr:uncharacterized protein TRIVIDRAFT_57769 [Trichoderma virens Gv29-8]EHK18981.1 hypothetical protein TRIVIDRAFT_57769 [Trichoderma virens Gv29-8]